MTCRRTKNAFRSPRQAGERSPLDGAAVGLAVTMGCTGAEAAWHLNFRDISSAFYSYRLWIMQPGVFVLSTREARSQDALPPLTPLTAYVTPSYCPWPNQSDHKSTRRYTFLLPPLALHSPCQINFLTKGQCLPQQIPRRLHGLKRPSSLRRPSSLPVWMFTI